MYIVQIIYFSNLKIIRKISINISKYIVRTNITPNQITFISLFFAFLGVYFISGGINFNLIIGGILIFFSLILDSVDGEVARLKRLVSKKGAFVDAFVDRLREGIVFFGISSAVFNQTNSYFAWVLGFISLFSVYMTNFVIDYSGKLDKTKLKSTHDNLKLIKIANQFGIKRSFFTLGIDVQLFLIVLGLIFNKLFWIFWFFIIIQNLYWILIFFFIYKK